MLFPYAVQGKLEFLIELYEKGQFSTFLRHAQIGDKLIARGAQGQFVLNTAELKPRWFIGGGTGLSPLLAMTRALAEWGDTQPTRLFFGVRYVEDIFCAGELAALQAQLPAFQYDICVSRPDADWRGYTGSVVDAVNNALNNLKNIPEIYICGSNRLIDGILTSLKTAGIPEKSIFYERFSVS